MWNRSARDENGKFSYEVFDWDGKLFERGDNIATVHEADMCGANAEARMTIAMMARDEDAPTMEEIWDEMGDDELLAELFPEVGDRDRFLAAT